MSTTTNSQIDKRTVKEGVLTLEDGTQHKVNFFWNSDETTKMASCGSNLFAVRTANIDKPAMPRTYEDTEYGITVHCSICGGTFDSQQVRDIDAMAEAEQFCGWTERNGQPICHRTEEHLAIENADLRRVLTSILTRWELEPKGAIFPAAAMREEVAAALREKGI